MRILIVDDDIDFARLVYFYLQSEAACDYAAGGEEALQMFEWALAENNPYDLVCLDIMMPNLNGHQTLSRMREMEQEHGIRLVNGCHVLMISAKSDIDTIVKSFMGMCDGYLVKPITRESLMNKLQEMQLLETAQSQRPA